MLRYTNSDRISTGIAAAGSAVDDGPVDPPSAPSDSAFASASAKIWFVELATAHQHARHVDVLVHIRSPAPHER